MVDLWPMDDGCCGQGNGREKMLDFNAGLFEFIKKSPTAFHAVRSIKEILYKNGFSELRENDAWKLERGGKYYVTRNDSSIIAFKVGAALENYSFTITTSHSDSPSFKVKDCAELEVRGHYRQLNTEGYGGMLCAPWFDRPLSLAGRVVLREGDRYITRLVDIDRDLLMIPSVAIHMNRNANEGIKYNKQVDTLPLFCQCADGCADFTEFLAGELGVQKSSIYGSELFLYNRMEPTVWGARKEFISAPRLDDLQCAYASLMGFLGGGNQGTVQVFACFDNEEVGSETKQGAASTFLYDVLSRCSRGMGMGEEQLCRALAASFMLSCDNAHALHPNHPEAADAKNYPRMNGGVVIKAHAGQKYTTDAVSAALFKGICESAGVPVQSFANRSDAVGGSTLGNIAMGHVSINSVDIGLAQLSMHSPYETAGVKDGEYLARAVEEFYKSRLICEKSAIRMVAF